jgi:REP element-mobilizing transposase RayT
VIKKSRRDDIIIDQENNKSRRDDIIIERINEQNQKPRRGDIIKSYMPGTFSQIYIQIVFAVKGRENIIAKQWKEELNKYISGIITNKGQKSIIVNGTSDHVHIFIGLKPSMAIADLVRDVKNNSSNFINEKKFIKGKFAWQEGYGAFSYAHSQIENVYQYIANQEEHHKKKTFKEEYMDFLQKFAIEYNEKYLFEWIDE